MQKAEKDAIRASRPILVNNMDTAVVMDYLISGNILDDTDETNVNAERTSHEKNRLILKLLATTRNTKDTFAVLIHGLDEANQRHLANMLRDHVESPKVAGSRPDSATDVGRKLISFGIPVKPEVFVYRNDLVKTLQKAILKIPKDGGWVLIHGMGGSGKTVLASTALHCSGILTKFDTIIWLPLGNVDNEKLLLKFKILIQRLDPTIGTLPALTELEEAQNQLRDKLQDRSDSVLIVLDDVWKDVAKHFNNCGGAFLVTSRESKALDRVGGFKESVMVEKGFTYEQAEDIFCQVLNILPEKLPPEAKEIWIACEGSPLAIVMITSLLKHKPNRWEFYLKKLKERPDQIHQCSEYDHDSLDAVLRVSFDSLDSSLRDRYLKLAAFPKGQPLWPNILAVVWDVEEIEEAEDIIDELVSLSLAREEWSKKMKKFYVIHDMQMAFLRHEDKQQDKQSHKSLIDAYRKRFGSWELVPEDDKYFLWYIGYHLDAAGYTEELVNIFTDLHFIEAKIRVTGAWDVINDYARYRHLFKKHNQLESMESFNEFLYKNMFALSAAEQGQVVDLVQLGLCDPPDKSVFPQAESMAKQRLEKPYWKWTNGKMAKSRCFKKYLIKWSTPLTALSVSPDGNRMLIGRGDGCMNLVSSQSFQILETINIDGQASVGGLGFSADGEFCLICTDSEIYHRKLPPCQTRRSSLPTPNLPNIDDLGKRFARCHLNNESERVTKLEAAAVSEYVLSCCTVVNDTAYVGTHSGTVLSVNLAPFTLRSEKNTHKEAITAIAVSLDGRLVTSASSDRSVIVYDLEEMEVRARKKFEAAVQDCLLTTTKDLDKLLVVSATSREISIWQVADEREIGESIKSKVRDADFRVLALSSNNRLLAAGMSNSVIKLWDFDSKEELFELPAVSGAPSALAFTSDSTRLLAVDNSGALVVWEVAATSALLDYSSNNLIMAQRFAVQWGPSGGLLASQDARSRHLICVRNMEAPVHEKITVNPLNFTIECVALSPDGIRMSVGSEDGHLQEWARPDQLPVTPSCCITKLKASAAVKCLRYLNRGEVLAAGLSDGEIWLLKKDVQVPRVLSGHTKEISGLFDLSDSARLLSTSHDGFVRLWRLDVGQEEGDSALDVQCHEDRIISADVSTKQKWLVTGSVDGFAKVRAISGDSRTFPPISHGDCVRSVRFCPQREDLVASGDDRGRVRVWRVGSPGDVDTLECPLDMEQWVVDLEWLSEDLLVSVCGVLCVWSVGSKQLLHTLYPRSSVFTVVHATQEGQGDRIVAVDSSGTLYLLKRVSSA